MKRLLAAFAFVACSSSPPPQPPARCIPGAQILCSCPGGAGGVQVCRADGSYGACGCREAGTADVLEAGTAVDAGVDTGDAITEAGDVTGELGADGGSDAGDAAETRDATAAGAYHACAQAGVACADGTVCLEAIQTRPMTPPGSTCTIGCPSGEASACPGYRPKSRLRVVCLGGSSPMSQCVRRCDSNADCEPFGTRCVEAFRDRLCVP